MVKTEDVGERMAKVETRLTEMDKKFDTTIINQREDFRIVFKKLDDLEKRYAGKWVEKVAIGAIIAILGTLVALIVSVSG